jgi:hypothetical protein
LTFGAGSVTSWQIIREEDLNMSISVTIEELYGLEQWAKANADSSPQFDVAVRAATRLRDLMTQELSQKNLLKYLRQQTGIIPKSERGSNSLAKQSGESVPRAILRQP